MSDSADELILKMQHLQAQAKAQQEERGLRAGLERFKSAAQRLAAEEQAEVDRLDKVLDEAEEKMEALRVDGVTPEEAPPYVAAKAQADDAKRGLIHARAKLNYALDQLNEVERREYEATQAEVRAEFHGQMAEDPLFNKT
jgi:hypothetical protein